MAKKRRIVMSENKRLQMLADMDTINFYRNNPIIACEDILGIKLLDSQAWILQESWNKERILWACCRNFGKSFLIAVFAILKAILYENQNIYIISSVGDQAKETFLKIEEIVLNQGRTSESIDGLKDIVIHETVSNPSNKTGFKHNPAGYNVKFYNGSNISSLNSKPDNIRGENKIINALNCLSME